MMNKGKKMTAAVLSLVLAGSCSISVCAAENKAPDAPEAMESVVEEVTETAALAEGFIPSLLTGLPVPAEIGLRRPAAFMIDNVKDAVPQSGIGAASIYYESEVETNLSRICAVFEDYDNEEKIGPLRSCRDYFISLVSGLDAIYEHYGQAAYALPYLESDEVDNISAMMNYAQFFRSGPHSAPHNAYVSGSAMNSMIDTVGYRKELKSDFTSQFTFAEDGTTVTNEGGDAAAYVELGFPYNKPYFVFDEETGLYERYQYGGPQYTEQSDAPLSVRNIILEYHDEDVYQNSEYLHYEMEGSGEGKYITEGKAVDITWEREDFYSPVVYKLTDGTPLTINTGKSWIALIQKANIDDCLIGSSADDAVCVVPDDRAQAIIEDAHSWRAGYKAGELEYLTAMAQIRTDNVAKHGGKTKVEPGLP